MMDDVRVKRSDRILHITVHLSPEQLPWVCASLHGGDRITACNSNMTSCSGKSQLSKNSSILSDAPHILCLWWFNSQLPCYVQLDLQSHSCNCCSYRSLHYKATFVTTYWLHLCWMALILDLIPQQNFFFNLTECDCHQSSMLIIRQLLARCASHEISNKIQIEIIGSTLW